MIMRPYHPDDLIAITDLFYRAVPSISGSDYSKEQLDAWADGYPDLEAWNQSFLERRTLTAWKKDALIAFADLDSSGYLDRMFVDPRFLRQGIASALCDALEKESSAPILTVHVSLTAFPFLLRRGYQAVKEEQVFWKGIRLTRTLMKKTRRSTPFRSC